MTSIVIVDDQNTNRRVLGKIASIIEKDVDVAEFADAQKALSYVREHTPDLLIADYRMPKISGLEFIRQFRRFPNCSDVPAVIVAAHYSSAVRQLASEAGSSLIVLPIYYADSVLRALFLTMRQRTNGFSEQEDANSRPLGFYSSPETDRAATERISMLNSLLENIGGRLVARIKQLDIVTTDLDHVLAATPTPIVIIDEKLRLLNFTPTAREVYELSIADIGRSISDLTCCLRYEEFEADFALTQKTSRPFERHVVSVNAGIYYTVRLTPRLNRDGAPAGAVITIVRMQTWYSGSA